MLDVNRVLSTAENRVVALQERFRRDIQLSLREMLDECPDSISGLLRYHLGWEGIDGEPISAITGKALRPILCLTASELAGGDWRLSLPAAASIELVHNFSLIHDDIQDRDERRWGRPTLWSIHGESKGIVAGNTMRVIAYQALMSLVAKQIPDELITNVAFELTTRSLEMIEGQYLDLLFEDTEAVSIDQYLDMTARKTGALIESAMYMGAFIATGDRDVADAFGKCGRRLGLAFQIRDDYLGIWGDPACTGKAVGADIRRKKKSLPIVHMFVEIPSADREWLIQTYRSSDEISEEKISTILHFLQDTGSREFVQEIAFVELQHALEAVEQLALPEESVDTLQSIGSYFVMREK